MLQRSEPGEPGGKARLSAGIKLGRKTSASSDARNVVLFATATKRLRECGVRKEVSTGWRRQFFCFYPPAVYWCRCSRRCGRIVTLKRSESSEVKIAANVIAETRDDVHLNPVLGSVDTEAEFAIAMGTRV